MGEIGFGDDACGLVEAFCAGVVFCGCVGDGLEGLEGCLFVASLEGDFGEFEVGVALFFGIGGLCAQDFVVLFGLVELGSVLESGGGEEILVPGEGCLLFGAAGGQQEGRRSDPEDEEWGDEFREAC